MLEKVLNERYKILNKLGEGGMAEVYEAMDLLLERKVAVKILRSEHVSDKNFVKKFHQEARAVARISHPNVVNIFDIGQDGKNHYLVMEKVEGTNLKDIIKQRGKLSLTEALDIVQQICSALAVAHKNGIIHCDIKPHNILIDSSQNVKVTDFGIARAITSSTLTVTETIMGSAHYFSPEQAKGGEIKAYSDLYSLGIVLYEMVTGEVPFKGKSPVSVALKHIQKKPQEPKKINPDINDEINDLIMKALTKNPEERFKDAKIMQNRIIEILKKSKNSKKENKDFEPGTGDTRFLNRTDIKREAQKININQKIEKRNRINKKNDRNKSWLNEKLNLFKKIFLEKKKKKPVKTNSTENDSRWLIYSIAVFLILILSFIAYGVYFFRDYTSVPQAEVPNLVGLTYESAKNEVDELKLKLEIEGEQYHPDFEKDKIISHNPSAGNVIRISRPVRLIISKGYPSLEMPDIREKTLREARIILENEGFTNIEEEYIYDNNIAANYIIDQEPEPQSEIKADDIIKLIISEGTHPVRVKMPNLLGLKEEEALQIIKESDLKPGNITTEKSKRYLEGQVTEQQHETGEELPKNTEIDLVISEGIINQENDQVYTRTVGIPVRGLEEVRVRIIIEDNNGKDVAYDVVHEPGIDIAPVVNSVGPTIYQIYFDDRLVYEEEIGY